MSSRSTRTSTTRKAKPELLEEWPAEDDIVAPVEVLPENLRQSMGDHWEHTQKNRKALEERNNK